MSNQTLQSGTGAEEGSYSSPALVAILFDRRRVLLAGAVIGGLIASVMGLLAERTFSSTAIVISGQASAVSGLGGVAARIGLASQPSTGELSNVALASLLRSDVTMQLLVERPLGSLKGSGEGSGRMVDVLEPGADRVEVRRFRAAKKFKEQVSVRFDSEAGTLAASVSGASPELAQDLLTNLLEIVDSMASDARTRVARAERQFLGVRIDTVQGELRAAEDDLRAFITGNRSYASDPTLTLEYERRQRSVVARRALLSSIEQSYEQVRANEARLTPVLVQVYPPTVPALADRRYLLIRGVLGVAVGTLAALFWLFASGIVRAAAEHSPELRGLLRGPVLSRLVANRSE